MVTLPLGFFICIIGAAVITGQILSLVAMSLSDRGRRKR